MVESQSGPSALPARVLMATLRLAAVAAFLAFSGRAAPALAGQASSGELFFYPCSACHPVPEGGAAGLPNGFEGHDIVLEGHDRLGEGEAACVACHDDPAKDPGKLRLADGGLVDIKGDVSLVCYRCHSAKYEEFVAGTHGRRQPSCVAAGCHDPHTPAWIYAGPLLPFTGSGFQFKALGGREPFAPLASPPLPAPVETPRWFSALAIVGFAAAFGQVGRLVLGRSKR